jgi:1-acyl-sn-glycerol-3-phosphate acyltransferase
VIISLMGLSALAAIVGLLLTGSSRVPDTVARWWSRASLAVCGIRLEVEGLTRLDPSRPYVLISNHQSNFDVWAAVAGLPVAIRFVAKRELLRIPLFGRALAMSGHIVIDRSDPYSAVRQINALAAQAIDGGLCVPFYAEGTRSDDGSIGPFKKGGVATAVRAGLPIVPVTVSGTRKFLPKGYAVIRPGGRVRLTVGEPISTAGMATGDLAALTERVRAVVVAAYDSEY